MRNWEEGDVTFPANHFVAVVFGRQGLEGGLDDAAAETEDEVEGGFLHFDEQGSSSVNISFSIIRSIRGFSPPRPFLPV